jgi:membrane protein implicated in regulation of membrane protease activity
MVVFTGVELGWLLIVLGALVLLFEAYSPGFFMTVPGTVMIMLGILLVLGVDIFSSVWGIVLAVVVAIASASLTVWFYSRLNRGEGPPTTMSRDTVIGRTGHVTRRVDAQTLDGKVRVGGHDWSAHSTGAAIAEGTAVRVVGAEGVHIVVEEV